jgi:hypothetical protein
MTTLDVSSRVTVEADVIHGGAAAAMLQIPEFKLFHTARRSWNGREASKARTEPFFVE